MGNQFLGFSKLIKYSGAVVSVAFILISVWLGLLCSVVFTKRPQSYQRSKDSVNSVSGGYTRQKSLFFVGIKRPDDTNVVVPATRNRSSHGVDTL